MSPAQLERQDAIKDCYGECIIFREQGGNTYNPDTAYIRMDCPLISGSIIVEDYYQRVIITLG